MPWYYYYGSEVIQELFSNRAFGQQVFKYLQMNIHSCLLFCLHQSIWCAF